MRTFTRAKAPSSESFSFAAFAPLREIFRFSVTAPLRCKRLSRSFFNRYEAARRGAAFFYEQRQNDHLHSTFGNLIAVHQTLAPRHDFPNQRAVAARLGTAVLVRA